MSFQTHMYDMPVSDTIEGTHKLCINKDRIPMGKKMDKVRNMK